MTSSYLLDIQKHHEDLKPQIVARLEDFRRVWNKGTDEDLFAELAFCLLTPQSRAKTCWPAVVRLRKKGMLFSGTPKEVLAELNGIRFKERKAEYIVTARKQFTKGDQISIRSVLTGFSDSGRARDWLVENVKGLGYKESGHFLRNIGLGENLAILDRHILKNLVLMGTIEEIPKSLTKKRYLEIEKKMEDLSAKTKIPMSHLDLLLWSKETGEIFK